MKCDEFTEWMQVTLDDRSELKMPRGVRRHYSECELCRGQMDAWNQIATILPGDSGIRVDTRTRDQRPVAVAVAVLMAVATVWLFSFTILPQDNQVSQASDVDVQTTGVFSQGNPSASGSFGSEIVDSEIAPVDWWREIQRRDWIGETMPAVKSVRDGVAPLGRSIVRAVTILTTGGRVQPS